MYMGHPSLPHVPCYLPSKAFHGYTLFSPMGGTGTWLIDMHGRFVHHWEVPIEPAGHAILLPNGHLLFAGKLPDAPFPEFGLMVEYCNSTGMGKRCKYKDPFMHHDFRACQMKHAGAQVGGDTGSDCRKDQRYSWRRGDLGGRSVKSLPRQGRLGMAGIRTPRP
jgi:hypothetical protein